MMLKHKVFLGVGTNLGDRAANLKAAGDALPPKVRLLKQSGIYETEPWGYKDQPSFYNQVWETETDFTPTQLLDHLKSIERKLGRVANFRYGPRLIDLDILFYDQRIVKTSRLEIPHPHITERAFVLVPMVEIAPSFQHPALKITMRELLEKVADAGSVRAL